LPTACSLPRPFVVQSPPGCFWHTDGDELDEGWIIEPLTLYLFTEMKRTNEKEQELGLGSRLLIGAVAGFVGTMAMTAAMRRLHERLPAEERYPLTPREIIDSVAERQELHLGNEAAKDATLAGHFLYGAACGSLLGAIDPQMGRRSGALGGMIVWLVSYMGWIPAARILKPATEHPARRNLLMMAVHLVWGASTAATMREIMEVRQTMIEEGPDRDAPG
jgi:uncharacterized membrane protein YagU involved in acid resistance